MPQTPKGCHDNEGRFYNSAFGAYLDQGIADVWSTVDIAKSKTSNSEQINAGCPVNNIVGLYNIYRTFHNSADD